MTSGSRPDDPAGIGARSPIVLLVVRDDGGADRPWTPGVGLDSMRQRALQVGGTLRAGATGGGGRVEATLPLGRAPLAGESGQRS